MGRVNPFEKYLTKEDRLQIAICDYIDLQYPKVLYTHPHNEGKRTKFEQFKAKKLRMTPGIPDLLIFHTKPISLKQPLRVGLALELKIKPNTPTENQINCLAALNDQNWECHVVYDFDSAKVIIDNYLKV